MNAMKKLSQELHRLLSERLTLIFMALTAAATVWFSLNGTGKTAADAFIIQPARSCSFLGAFLFALLTLVQFHRDFKNHTNVIILTSTDPLHHQVRKTLGLIGTAIVTTLIVSVFTLPYGIIKTGDYFQFATFLTGWYLIFLGALIFSVLMTAGFYMLTKRLEVTFIIMVGLIMLSMLFENMVTLNPSYLFYWVQTTAYNFSDLITNQFQIDMILWNRLVCLIAALGLWTLGLCTFRRYGLSLFGSFFANCRRVWIPVLLVVSILFSNVSFAFEPIFDDSKPRDLSGMISSGTGMVTFFGGEPEVGNPELTLTDKSFTLDVDAKGRKLSGIAKYKVRNDSGKAQSLPLQANTGIQIDRVLINGAEGKAIRGETGESSTANWTIELPAADVYDIQINYSGRMLNDNTILQRASNGIADGYVWLPAIGTSPSVDIKVSDDCAFYGTLSLDEKLEPVFARGNSTKMETKNGKSLWQFTGRTGSQSISLIAAEYMTRTFEAGGRNIALKYFKKHDKAITEMDAVNVIKAAIDYFTEAYGPLIYQQNLTILELPAYVSGGFAGGNMSAMDETNFNVKGYLPVDALDPHSGGGIDVLVHEIAHQWWGLANMPMQDGISCWSAEGITSYSTYCFMKHYFGEAYVQEHYLKIWQQDWNTYKNAFYIRHPEYLAKLSQEDVSRIMGSLLNMRLYSIMPLMMLKGEEHLGGTAALQEKLSALYLSRLGQLITYDDFLAMTGLTKEVLELE